MPIQKFKSLDDARRALWTEPGSDENIRAIRYLLGFWSHVRPVRFPIGVFKYRSIQEANAAREQGMRDGAQW